jgi:hypothetical protein
MKYSHISYLYHMVVTNAAQYKQSNIILPNATVSSSLHDPNTKYCPRYIDLDCVAQGLIHAKINVSNDSQP